MTKNELIKKVSKKLELSEAKTKPILEAVFSTVKDTLSDGENVSIGDLGILKVIQKKEKECRNPQTGDKMISKAHKAIKFQVSKSLKEEVR